MAIKLFGFNLGKKEVTQVEKPEQSSFVMPQAAVEDGAITVQSVRIMAPMWTSKVQFAMHSN